LSQSEHQQDIYMEYIPKLVKTTLGKVLPISHSKTPPMTIKSPPKKKYAAVSEAPDPPAPLQPIKIHESGVRLSKNPTSALQVSAVSFVLLAPSMTYIGVGLPKVLRSSPATLFCGDRYSFSKSSGEMETLPAVRIRFSALSASMLWSRW